MPNLDAEAIATEERLLRADLDTVDAALTVFMKQALSSIGVFLATGYPRERWGYCRQAFAVAAKARAEFGALAAEREKEECDRD